MFINSCETPLKVLGSVLSAAQNVPHKAVYNYEGKAAGQIFGSEDRLVFPVCIGWVRNSPKRMELEKVLPGMK